MDHHLRGNWLAIGLTLSAIGAFIFALSADDYNAVILGYGFFSWCGGVAFALVLQRWRQRRAEAKKAEEARTRLP